MADRTRRERVLTFLLVPAIVVAVVVLIVLTFRSSANLERLREQSVVEATLTLANEKSDRLDKRIIEQDNAVLSLVDINDRDDFGRAWLTVSARQTPSVSSVMLLDLSSRDHEVVAFATRAPPLEAEGSRRLLVQEMLPTMELDAEPRSQLRHLHKTYQGQSYLVSYWQRELRGHRYLLVAWHDVPRIVHDLFPTLYSERDQHSRVNVVDEDGRIVFGPNLIRGGFTIGRRFETTLYKWRLNVTLISAEELTTQVARKRLLEIALASLSWLVVIVGLTVVLIAVFRERKLSNLKSDFVANVSHELKTPLALVRMFGELLESGRVESDEKRQQYLQIILSESERLSALIENVLDFAKVERGKASYEFTRASVRDVVARAVEAMPTARSARRQRDRSRAIRRALAHRPRRACYRDRRHQPAGQRSQVRARRQTRRRQHPARCRACRSASQRRGCRHFPRGSQAHLRTLRARNERSGRSSSRQRHRPGAGQAHRRGPRRARLV